MLRLNILQQALLVESRQSEPVLINFPQTTGVGPGIGLHAKDDDSASRDQNLS